MAPTAIGLIETRGLVALTACLEAMGKMAAVECVLVRRVSSGYLVAAIRGELASVREALDAAQKSVARYGTLRGVQIYPNPHPAAFRLLEQSDGWLPVRNAESSEHSDDA